MARRPYPRGLAIGAGVALAAVAARRLGRVAVTGGSMRPALEPGDRLLLVRRCSYRPGAVVAVPDPRAPERLLVKRVERVLPDGRLEVLGDDPSASTDSRAFGPVDPALVRGRAVWRYAPPERTGPVRTRGTMPRRKGPAG